MKRILVVIGALLVSGCGGNTASEETADLVPVSGSVTLNGEPLAGASVQFVPTDQSAASSAYFGATNESGEFELKSRGLRTGCEVGDFIVVISKFAMEDGTPIAEDADPGDAALGMEHLPERYSSREASELRASVPTNGKTDFLFELSSE